MFCWFLVANISSQQLSMLLISLAPCTAKPPCRLQAVKESAAFTAGHQPRVSTENRQLVTKHPNSLDSFQLSVFIFLYIFLNIYFICARSQLQDAGSSVAACGIQLPDQGSNPGPLHWEHGVLATRPSGKPPGKRFLKARKGRGSGVPDHLWTFVLTGEWCSNRVVFLESTSSTIWFQPLGGSACCQHAANFST